MLKGSPSTRGGLKGGYKPKKNLAGDSDGKEVESIDSSGGAEIEDEDKKSVNNDSSSETELRISRDPKRCDFCGDTSHKSRFCSVLGQEIEPLSAGTRGVGGTSNRICYNCHEEGHVRAECPKRIATCYFCKEEGHVKADCPVRASQEAKKRERVTLSYTFRKSASQEKDKGLAEPVNTVYEGPEEESADDLGDKSNSPVKKKSPHVVVPLPVPASQVKTQVSLRSKLLSSDSELSVSKKIMRSGSSEEEDNSDDSFESDYADSPSKNLPIKIKLKDKMEVDVNGEASNETVVDLKKLRIGETCENPEEEEDLQTISVEVDGCVEFDDDSSYFDCSEGEDVERTKRGMDECYGEDGALIDESGEPIDNNVEKEEKVEP